MSARRLVPALAGLLGWLTSATWSPFVAQPWHYLGVAAVACAVVAALSATLPTRRVVVHALQVAGALAVLQWHFRDLGPLWRSIGEGAIAINTHEAPVSADLATTAPFLAACAVGVAIVLDLVVVTWGRAVLAGLPLLLALTVPISTLDRHLSIWLLLAILAGFASLLALAHRGHVGPLAATLAVGAGVVGLLAAAALPVGQGIDLHRGDGPGRGETSVSNPMVDIRRGVVNQSRLPMLTVESPRRTPRYLRLAVLDQFDNGRWFPSSRDLPQQNRASAGIPRAPGLYASVTGNVETYHLKYSAAFSSPWLATPYPYVSVEATGDYRYDDDTLDLFNVDDGDEPGTHTGYDVEAFIPSFDAEDLNSAGSAPTDIEESMTALPKALPKRVTTLAARVTADKRTDYQRVVALQNWFRSAGGFRYSLWDAPASTGMDGLMEFLTTGKSGYCEQFATAMTVMARAIGVPARVAVGFGHPKSSPSPGTYVFTGDNMHAWTEVYFEGYGWVVFDPTPAVQSGTAPNYSLGVDETPAVAPSVSQAPSAQPSPTRPDRDLASGARTDSGQGAPVWPWLAGGGLALLLTLCTPRALRARARHRRLDSLPAAKARDAVDAIWTELRASVVDRHLEWPRTRSPRGTFLGLQRQLNLDPGQVAALGRIATVIERVRYGRDPLALNDEKRSTLRTDVDTVLARIDRVRDGSRWWPRSVWPGWRDRA